MRERPSDYYKALYAIAGEVESAVAVEKELGCLVKATTEAMGAKGCSILVLTGDQKGLVHMASHGLSELYVKKGLVDLDPVTAEALKGKPMIVRDITTDKRVQYREEAIKEGICSMASFPLMIKGEIAGVLRIYTDSPVDLSGKDIAFLTGVANLGATAISRDQVQSEMERHYEERLREKSEELARITEAKNRLIESVSVIAHDLKSPLAAIQSYFAVMLGGYSGELNPKQRQMIERSSIRIDGLLNLISNLLDISRIEMGQIAQEVERLSVADILHGSLEDAGQRLRDKGIALRVDIADDLPTVHGSNIRLKQVFNNLLDNAMKFTPEGGAVNISMCRNAGSIEVKVQDTGIGIPASDIPHICNDFYRASNAEGISGTGLGLSIVSRIVKAHGGEIRVSSPCSETGKGTEVVILLPDANGVPSKADGPRPAGVSGGQPQLWRSTN